MREGEDEDEDEMADRTALMVAEPPWTWNSRTSSPVTVLGEGKYKTKDWESTIFLVEGS